MKAPSVREGSKENSTQVWKAIASTPGAVLGDGKKLINRFMAGNPKLRPGAEPQKFPRYRSCPRDGDRSSKIQSEIYPDLPISKAGSGYEGTLMELWGL